MEDCERGTSEPSEDDSVSPLRFLVATRAKVDAIEAKVDAIEAKVDLLLSRVENVSSSCSNMDDHIGFVHSVYATLRSPLQVVTALCSPRRLLGIGVGMEGVRDPSSAVESLGSGSNDSRNGASECQLPLPFPSPASKPLSPVSA